MFTTTPLDDGGTLGFGAMGGPGFDTFDLSDPAAPEVLGHLDTTPSHAGTEFDNVDVSQYARTGDVLTNGYPMNSNCDEPYRDVFVVDVRDPARPSVAATLPRPVPREGAGFTDYGQRGGSFGPKRSGQFNQPGGGRDGVMPYAFYTAGLQIFDVTDPTTPRIGACFVPRFPTAEEMPDWTFNNANIALFTEYDRNIIWLFTTQGVHALSTPMPGEPVPGPSPTVWPPRDRGRSAQRGEGPGPCGRAGAFGLRGLRFAGRHVGGDGRGDGQVTALTARYGGRSPSRPCITSRGLARPRPWPASS